MSTSSGTRWVALVVLLGVALPVRARSAEAKGDAGQLADEATMIALAVALSCADAPEAVAAPPAGAADVPAAGTELELVATVNARALQFDEVPKVDVVLHGNGKRRTVWRTERVNLPAHPEPGVTYRDVQIRLTITGDVDELAALLGEAKRASRGVRIEPADPATPAAAKP